MRGRRSFVYARVPPPVPPSFILSTAMTNRDGRPPDGSGAAPAPNGRDRFSEEEARALWERALQLQLEARKREEERTLGLPSGDDPGPAGSADGFTSEEVRAAAREVGISPNFIEEALAERSARALQGPASGRMDRFAGWLLRAPDRVISLSRTLNAPPEDVVEVVKRLFPAAPFHLGLRDIQGDDLVRDGVLVFQMPGWEFHVQNPGALASKAVYAELDLLAVTVRPAGDEASPTATRLTIRAPLDKARRSHAGWAAVVGGILALAAGGVGGVLGGIVGAGVGLPALLLALASGLLALGSAAAVAGASVLGIRRYFRWTLRKGEEALDDLLRGVDVHLRTREPLAPGHESPRLTPGGGAPPSHP